jgi:hypothetical protein
LYRDLKRQEFYLEEQRQNETSNKKSWIIINSNV